MTYPARTSCPGSIRLFFSVVLLLGLAAAPALAQTAPPASGVAYFRYAEPGQPTLQVQLWGGVRAPGVYEVQQGTDLLQLLAFAGGPAVPIDQPGRTVLLTVSISRVEAGGRSPSFEAPLEDLVRGVAPLPSLREGDIVRVHTDIRQHFSWRDAAAIVSTLGTLALLIFRVTDQL